MNIETVEKEFANLMSSLKKKKKNDYFSKDESVEYPV